MRSSESESLSISDPSILTLPTELDTVDRSLRLICGHVEPGPRLGESSIIELTEAFRDGIPIASPFCVMTGEESGDDCSARVEWWRLVQAREKSRPRECRGSEVTGEAKDVEMSNWGDNGTRVVLGAAIDKVRGGICKERPRERKSGLLGVCGEELGTSWSSLDRAFM